MRLRRINESKSKKDQYEEYIKEHLENVQKGYNWLKGNLAEVLKPIKDIDAFEKQLKNHDKSKYSEEEFDPYTEYFYGDKSKAGVKDEFNYAWLHHIHNNPHHWQYWVLVNDDDGTIGLEMPYEYIVEMILDWWTFSWKTNNLAEIFNWYKDHKKKFIFNPKTQKTVEEILDKMRDNIE